MDIELDRLHQTLQFLLAAQYTRRYQEIVTRIPPEVLYHSGQIKEEYWKGKESVASTIHAYIDLCAEELRIYRAGQIPEEVWKNWEEGIQAGMRLPAVQSLWKSFFKHGPYEELRQYLKNMEQNR